MGGSLWSIWQINEEEPLGNRSHRGPGIWERTQVQAPENDTAEEKVVRRVEYLCKKGVPHGARPHNEGMEWQGVGLGFAPSDVGKVVGNQPMLCLGLEA
jgi:hypothetical protein